MNLIVFGNNVNQSTDPTSHQPIIKTPQPIKLDGNQIIYIGWSCTITRDDDRIYVYGIDDFVSSLESLESLKGVKKVMANDRPRGLLFLDGSLWIYQVGGGDESQTGGGSGGNGQWIKSQRSWSDVCILLTGDVIAVNSEGIFNFDSLFHLLCYSELNAETDTSKGLDAVHSPAPTPLSHPLLNRSQQNQKQNIKLYTTESRILIHQAVGTVHHLLEVFLNFKNANNGHNDNDEAQSVPNDSSSGSTSSSRVTRFGSPKIRLMEDLEGVRFEVVVGSMNRVGIVSEAGEVWFSAQPGVFEVIDVCADLEMREEMVDVKREGKEVDEGRDEEHDDVDNDAEGVEVKYAALGSVHEVVVLDNDQVWVRGSNQYGQLGMGDLSSRDEFVKHPFFGHQEIAGVYCSRWATFILLKD